MTASGLATPATSRSDLSWLGGTAVPTDREIDAAVDIYLERLESGDILGAKAAEEHAAALIERKRFEDDGL